MVPSLASLLHRFLSWRTTRILTSAAMRWHDRHALRLGAAISFYSIFSLAPLLIIITGAAALVFGNDAAQGRLFTQLSELMGASSARALEAIIASAHAEHRQGLIASVTAFALTFVGASGVFVELEDSISAIFGGTVTTRTPIAGLVWARLHAFALVLGLCFLLLVSLVFSAALSAVQDYLSAGALPAVAVGGELLNLCLLSAAFGFLIRYLPYPHPRWSGAWIGGFTAAVLFTVGKWAVGFYLGRSTVSSAYGAAGSLVVVMIWVYYTAQVLLFGAALAYATHKIQTEDQAGGNSAGAVLTNPHRGASTNDATVPRRASRR